MIKHLERLREWWAKHGSNLYADADEWINSMTNVELMETFDWFEDD